MFEFVGVRGLLNGDLGARKIQRFPPRCKPQVLTFQFWVALLELIAKVVPNLKACRYVSKVLKSVYFCNHFFKSILLDENNGPFLMFH